MTPSSPPFVFSDENMDRIKNLVLTSLRLTLVKDIDPRHHLAVLQQCYVIDARESAEIKSACSRSVYEGAEKFLDTLMTKGSRGYNVFCKALLVDCTQLHILNQLSRLLEQYKYNFQRHVEQVEQQRYSSANYSTNGLDTAKFKPVSSCNHTVNHHHHLPHTPQPTAHEMDDSNCRHSNAQNTTTPRTVHRARSPMPSSPESHIQEYYPKHFINEPGTHFNPMLYDNGFPTHGGYVYHTHFGGPRSPQTSQNQCWSPSTSCYDVPAALSVTGRILQQQQASSSSYSVPAAQAFPQTTENFQHQFYVNHFTEPSYYPVACSNVMINTEEPLDGPCGQYVN